MTSTIDILEFKRSFPRQPGKICFNHCRVSPLYRPAAEKEAESAMGWAEHGIDWYFMTRQNAPALRTAVARLIGAESSDIAITKNCSEGLNLIAQGFRFRPGEEVISYIHEFPSNHHPWRSAERFRSVNLKLLPNRNPLSQEFEGLPCAWDMEDLDRLVSPQTRVVALSHVQFTSGFAADLHVLGKFCRERNIFLVIDAAQSLGCLPIDVKSMNVSALVSSGWKWLMGPYGSGLLYTSPEFREELNLIFPGPMSMKPAASYLDLSWNPLESAAKFEYSALPYSLVAALRVCVDEIFVSLGSERIWNEILRLQNLLIEGMRADGLDVSLTRAAFSERHRSGICSFLPRRPAAEIVSELGQRGIVLSERDGYLRVAPHFYNTEADIEKLLEALREILL